MKTLLGTCDTSVPNRIQVRCAICHTQVTYLGDTGRHNFGVAGWREVPGVFHCVNGLRRFDPWVCGDRCQQRLEDQDRMWKRKSGPDTRIRAPFGVYQTEEQFVACLPGHGGAARVASILRRYSANKYQKALAIAEREALR
jgi:hypothetical protein